MMEWITNHISLELLFVLVAGYVVILLNDPKRRKQKQSEKQDVDRLLNNPNLNHEHDEPEQESLSPSRGRVNGSPRAPNSPRFKRYENKHSTKSYFPELLVQDTFDELGPDSSFQDRRVRLEEVLSSKRQVQAEGHGVDRIMKSKRFAMARINSCKRLKTPVELKIVAKAFDETTKGSFIKASLTPEEKERLVYALELVSFKTGALIIKQGTVGDYLYVVKTGRVAQLIKEEQEGSKRRKRHSMLGSLNARKSTFKKVETKPQSLSIMTHTIRKQKPEGKHSMVHRISKESIRPTREWMLTTETIAAARIEKQFGPCVETLGPSQIFGELALLYDCARDSSWIAAEPCSLWRIDRRDFRRIMKGQSKTGSSQDANIRAILITLQEIDFFSVLDEQTLIQVAHTLKQKTFKDGERIIQKDELGNSFHIIISGTVRITDIGQGDAQHEDITGGPGFWFGERALLTGDRTLANVTAIGGDVTTLAMTTQEFEAKLGSLQHLFDVSMLRRHLVSWLRWLLFPIQFNGVQGSEFVWMLCLILVP
jgi:CRP-like cAMP-binding protein